MGASEGKFSLALYPADCSRSSYTRRGSHDSDHRERKHFVTAPDFSLSGPGLTATSLLPYYFPAVLFCPRTLLRCYASGILISVRISGVSSGSSGTLFGVRQTC